MAVSKYETVCLMSSDGANLHWDVTTQTAIRENTMISVTAENPEPSGE